GRDGSERPVLHRKPDRAEGAVGNAIHDSEDPLLGSSNAAARARAALEQHDEAAEQAEQVSPSSPTHARRLPAVTRLRWSSIGGSVSSRARFIAVAVLGVMLAACVRSSQGTGAADHAGALGDDAITVASFDFPESEVLAEIYSEALESKGFRVIRQFDIGTREARGARSRAWARGAR